MTVESNAAPKLYTQCVAVYEQMAENSQESAHGQIWTGSLTTMVTDLGYSAGVYTKVSTRLRSMGCATMIQRGAGPIESVWQLNFPPTFDIYEQNKKEIAEKRKERAPKANADDVMQMVHDLNRRLISAEMRLSRLDGNRAIADPDDD